MNHHFRDREAKIATGLTIPIGTLIRFDANP